MTQWLIDGKLIDGTIVYCPNWNICVVKDKPICIHKHTACLSCIKPSGEKD